MALLKRIAGLDEQLAKDAKKFFVLCCLIIQEGDFDALGVEEHEDLAFIAKLPISTAAQHFFFPVNLISLTRAYGPFNSIRK